MRRAWNPFLPGCVGAFDECKVKKLLPKPEFEFKNEPPMTLSPEVQQIIDDFKRQRRSKLKPV